MAISNDYRRASDRMELAVRALDRAVASGTRDDIYERLSDTSVVLNALAEEANRLAKMAGQGRRGRRPEEEEDDDHEVTVAVQPQATEETAEDRQLDITELDDEEISLPLLSQARVMLESMSGWSTETQVRGLAEALLQSRNDARLATLRGVMRMFWHGCPDPWRMMVAGIAITRRYVQQHIPGLSQTEVAAMLDETKASVSIREKTTHNAYLERWGVKNPNAADGGLKSPETCAKYRQTNGRGQSRKKGEKRKRLAKAFQKVASNATSLQADNNDNDTTR